MIKVGDRIELVRMEDDPDPVAPGTRGVVQLVEVMDLGDGSREYITVLWDDGRSLGLVCPPDRYRRI